MTPALLTRTSMSPRQSAANARTEARLGEVERPHVDRCRRHRRGGGLALGGVADGEHDRAPLAAKAFAAARPMPLLAPVTIDGAAGHVGKVAGGPLGG